jgi:hypothetical protein
VISTGQCNTMSLALQEVLHGSASEVLER